MTLFLIIAIILVVFFYVLYKSDADFHAAWRAQEARLKDFAEWEYARFPERPKRSSWSEWRMRRRFRKQERDQ